MNGLIFPVLLPMLAAALCFLIQRFTWHIAVFATWGSFISSIILLKQVVDLGEIVYSFGGWVGPWGIEYRVDRLNAAIITLLSGIAAFILTGTRDIVLQEIQLKKQAFYYATFLLTITGLLGVLMTGDVFNLFVFIEISSLSAYTLIALGSDKRALLAAYRYLIFGTIGATFILLSIGFLYVMTGTLNMQDLANRLPAVQHTSTIKVALAFFIIGVGIKCALFPFHLWLPNAYTYAPLTVTSFFAAATTKVFIYVLIRFLYSVFSPSYVFVDMYMGQVLCGLAVLAMVCGGYGALRHDDLRKVFAYSSVSQIGYMVLGISLFSQVGLTASLLHLFHHSLIKAVLFLSLAGFVFKGSKLTLSDIQGLGRRLPITTAAFLVSGLGLIGVPLTGGLISKWYLLTASFASNNWLAVIAIMVTSIFALAYVWRAVEALYFTAPDFTIPTDFDKQKTRLSWLYLMVLWLLIIANLYIGLQPLQMIHFITDMTSLL